ncbi:hypothetical protein [Hyphomonas sp.]|uniref:hypothetical protein n=1 Tax=Hyphomonas sp. TaxID=87 RepID=UPI0035647368
MPNPFAVWRAQRTVHYWKRKPGPVSATVHAQGAKYQSDDKAAWVPAADRFDGGETV